MKQKLFTLFPHSLVAAILLGLFLVSCTSQHSLLTKQEYNNYQGTIFLKDGGQKKVELVCQLPTVSQSYLWLEDLLQMNR